MLQALEFKRDGVNCTLNQFMSKLKKLYVRPHSDFKYSDKPQMSDIIHSINLLLPKEEHILQFDDVSVCVCVKTNLEGF